MIAFDEDEYVIHVVHKHWYVFAVRIVVMLILTVVPLAALPILGLFTPQNEIFIYTLFTFAYSLFLILLWMTGFLMWTDYYLDMAIITNKRILDIEQRGLFSREVSAMRFETIQDITSDVEGIIPTFLNFGNLYIQSAATTREFVLTEIAKPDLVKEIISHELTRIVEKKPE